MKRRVAVWLDEDAYTIYQAVPHHRRGAWVNLLIKQHNLPPMPTATEAQRLRDLAEGWLRWLDTNMQGH